MAESKTVRLASSKTLASLYPLVTLTGARGFLCTAVLLLRKIAMKSPKFKSVVMSLVEKHSGLSSIN